MSTLILHRPQEVQYKQSRTGPKDLRPAFVARGASLSGGLSPFRVSGTAACTRSLSGPVRAGASKNQGAFRLKLRLRPLLLVDGLSAADRSLGDLPFLRCHGERISHVPCGPSRASAS